LLLLLWIKSKPSGLFDVTSEICSFEVCFTLATWLLGHLLHLPLAGLTEHAPMECGIENSCPHPCRCADGIVDCREKSLTSVPVTLPDDTTEL